MKIIDRVEIHRFRSISDTSIVTDELTIFSGVNNSGKSNVLKALNLFFNSETSFGSPFDFKKDYNHAFTGQAGGKRIIKITLFFSGQGEAALKVPFSVSRAFEESQLGVYEFASTDKVVQSRLDRNDGNVRRQFTRFLNKIEYFYIPAVRDKTFVQSLFLNFEQIINDDKSTEFNKKIQDLSSVLEKKSIEISDDFEAFIGMPTEAALSSKVTDILGAVEINVDSGIEILRRVKGETRLEKVKVNLFSSGDGILMSYLAYFLAHICKKLPNKRFIWGFEEPENSLEYSKTQKLAKDFNEKFVRYAQIFITTHSPAFINLKDEKHSAFYRAYINPDNRHKSTEVRTLENLDKLQQSLFRTAPLSNEYALIQKELGLVDYALEIEKVVENLIEKDRQYDKRSKELDGKYRALLEAHPQKIFICEDSSPDVVSLWEHLLSLYEITGVKVVSSEGSSNNQIETGIMYQQKLSDSYRPSVYRQVDRDGLLDAQIKTVETNLFTKYDAKFRYQYAPIPVNEVENFAIIDNTNFTEEFWALNKDAVAEDFERTAEAVINRFDKLFAYKEASFRQDGGQKIMILQDMRKGALLDWRRMMPGKSISKKISNFSPASFLRSADKTSLPKELDEYMNRTKQFFESA